MAIPMFAAFPALVGTLIFEAGALKAGALCSLIFCSSLSSFCFFFALDLFARAMLTVFQCALAKEGFRKVVASW